MSSQYYLDQAWEPSPDGEGFYVLRGGTNWASVEGHASEWLTIAAAIRKKESPAYRRCAAWFFWINSTTGVCGYHLYSPRNMASDRDVIEMDYADALALAENIIDVLRAAGEACVHGDYDPIYHGA